MTPEGPAIWCPACKRSHVFNAEATPTPGGAKWDWNGDVDHPTFGPSMNVQVGRFVRDGVQRDPKDPANWIMETLCHSWVVFGRIQFLADCQHKLAGTTVDLPDWPAESDWDSNGMHLG